MSSQRFDDPRLGELVHLLDPPAGKKLWFGGPTVVGCLRGVDHEQASWKPAPGRAGIWEYTLHIAYWNYAVRRNLLGLAKGGFPRSPADWPRLPERADQAAWKEDRALLRAEHRELVAAVRDFDPARLDDETAGVTATYRFIDLLHGIVMHDAYHVAQIQLLKRLYKERSEPLAADAGPWS